MKCTCDRIAGERVPEDGICRRCGGRWPGFIDVDEIWSLVDGLRARGVRQFEGLGVKLTLDPPRLAPPAPIHPRGPSPEEILEDLRRVEQAGPPGLDAVVNTPAGQALYGKPPSWRPAHPEFMPPIPKSPPQE